MCRVSAVPSTTKRRRNDPASRTRSSEGRAYVVQRPPRPVSTMRSHMIDATTPSTTTTSVAITMTEWRAFLSDVSGYSSTTSGRGTGCCCCCCCGTMGDGGGGRSLLSRDAARSASKNSSVCHGAVTGVDGSSGGGGRRDDLAARRARPRARRRLRFVVVGEPQRDPDATSLSLRSDGRKPPTDRPRAGRS